MASLEYQFQSDLYGLVVKAICNRCFQTIVKHVDSHLDNQSTGKKWQWKNFQRITFVMTLTKIGHLVSIKYERKTVEKLNDFISLPF